MSRDALAWLCAEIRVLRKKVEAMEQRKHPIKLILEELIPDMSDRDATLAGVYAQTNFEERPANNNEKELILEELIPDMSDLEEASPTDDFAQAVFEEKSTEYVVNLDPTDEFAKVNFEFRELTDNLKTMELKRYEILLPGVSPAENLGDLDLSSYEKYYGVGFELPILHLAAVKMDHEAKFWRMFERTKHEMTNLTLEEKRVCALFDHDATDCAVERFAANLDLCSGMHQGFAEWLQDSGADLFQRLEFEQGWLG